MDYLDPATGVPLQQAPMFLPNYHHQQQLRSDPSGYGPTQLHGPRYFAETSEWRGDRGRGRTRGRARGRSRGAASVSATLLDATARAEARNRDRYVDNMVTNPALWATVFATLQRNPDTNEAIRRDLEEQERRVARARENRGRRRQDDRGTAASGAAPPAGGDDERSAPPPDTTAPMDVDDAGEDNGLDDDQERLRFEDLPDLYGYLAGDMENIRQTVGVQRLDLLLDELDIEALWSARDVTISFGPLARVLLRLFIGPYATDEENMIVRMLNLGVERAARNFGFEDYGAAAGRQAAEPFVVTYRRRGRMLRDFAAFRYVLEITEEMGRIGHKHKNDLILLYLTLTTPEIRLHRRWNAEDLEGAMAFRDRVTGYAISTPLVVARPMTIEMKLDSVFGNVSANGRLLERSLLAASKNRNRKANGLSAAQEVEVLMADARLLDLSGGGGGGDANAMRAALRPYRIEGEHAALRHMLEMSAVVSMMAEEFRVFVAGAPQCRPAASDGRHGAGARAQLTSKRPHAFRRPIFFAFKPVAANKQAAPNV